MVGDVHGDAAAFAYAAATDRFVVQLGDLTDGGPDSADALRIMFRLIDEGRGVFLLGNHDLKLARVLAGQAVQVTDELAATLRQLDAGLRERTLAEIRRAPVWMRRGASFFVHGGFHTAMLGAPAPVTDLGRPSGALSRALFGEPTGRLQPDGYPERSLRWVDRIPAGLTVYCGHDRRSLNGRPVPAPRRRGRHRRVPRYGGREGRTPILDRLARPGTSRPRQRGGIRSAPSRRIVSPLR